MNLPHAARIAWRLQDLLERKEEALGRPIGDALEHCGRMIALLHACELEEENPPADEANRIAEEVAEAARELVAAIERSDAGFDRLGQCVRNLFECLGMGEEGAAISLRAGENPDSLQRPV